MGFFKKESKKQGRIRKTLVVTSALMLFMSFAPAMANNAVFDRVAGIETAYAAEATFSQYWQQDAQGNWHVYDGVGNLIKNAWLCDDAVSTNGQNVWYLIDENGSMITNGLVQDLTGNIYSLETSHNGFFGMLRYKSGTYDGVYLDLEASHGGSFAKIKNQAGIDALQAKCGLRAVDINNANCVYTSTFSAGSTAPTGTQGPGGGVAGGQEPATPQQPQGGGNGGVSWVDPNAKGGTDNKNYNPNATWG